MSNVALYRKWRPLTFDDVVGQAHITSALRAQVAAGRVSHAYLFTGTRGTGKTSCARILARAVCCEHPVGGSPCNTCAACRSMLDGSALDVAEIDAASYTGVDNIRLLRDEAGYSPTALSHRVYIIDEVHMLSAGAFNALLKILEEPPPYVLFILATTEIHKVPATILSRCQRYDFRRIPPETIAARLREKAAQEGIAIEPDACALLARLADGSMRDGISLLDRSLPESGPVMRAQVGEALGVPSGERVAAILDAVLRRDAAAALEGFAACYLDGRDVISLFDELLSLLRDLYIVRATGREEYLASACSDDPDMLRALADRAGPEELAFFVTCVSELLSRLTRTAIRRTDGEMCLLKMALRGADAAVAARPLQDRAPEAPRPAAKPKPAPAPAESAPAPAPEPEPEAAPEAEAAPEPAPTPAPTGERPAGARLRDAFLTLARDKVTPAVRTYLNLAEFSDEGGVVLIRVREEALGLMDKPAVHALLDETARALSYTAARVRGPAPQGQGGNPLDSLLENARRLGVETE